jgi:hypothetical protein
MFRAFFSALDSPALPLAAMLFFIVAFAVVLVRLFALRTRGEYRSIAALPLDDSDSPSDPEVTP